MSAKMSKGALPLVAVLVAAAVISTATVAAARDDNTRARRATRAVVDKGPCRDCFAVVDVDGTLVRGRRVKRVTHIGHGIYVVRFNREISTCTWQATIGYPGFIANPGPGFISVTGRFGTNDSLYVATYDATGRAENKPYHIVVTC